MSDQMPVAAECGCPTCTAAMAKPRAVPTSWPLAAGQLDPDTPKPAELQPPAEPSDQATEDARRKQLTADGGLHGQAERLAALNQRPDHAVGL
jgi:hypothetical protein